MSAIQAFGSPEKTASIPTAYSVHINQAIRVCKKKYFKTAPKDITSDHKVWSYANFMLYFFSLNIENPNEFKLLSSANEGGMKVFIFFNALIFYQFSDL